ncbi:MAG: hypothetical protein OXU20_09840 [Myxococcales bacterium]|nr:hypothetical protein [Myxococcales bacterium]MDD9971602.1 hypothetical protein [Myxococcales bacterium]
MNIDTLQHPSRLGIRELDDESISAVSGGVGLFRAARALRRLRKAAYMHWLSRPCSAPALPGGAIAAPVQSGVPEVGELGPDLSGMPTTVEPMAQP